MSKVDFDFNDLVKPDQIPCSLSINFFVKLRQTTDNIKNAAGNVAAITTFAGPSGICTLSAALFKSTILEATRQSVPYDPGNPSYQRTSATVNNTKCDHVLELAWDLNCDKLFAGVCPGTASWPSATFESVKQDHTNTLGSTVSSTVQLYYMEILHICCAMRGTLEYCTITHFINHLSPGMKAEVEVG